MVEVRDELEVERLRNLVVGFGWAISKQEFLAEKIVMTLEKPRAVPPVDVSPGPG